MDRGAWQATVHGVTKSQDTTERLHVPSLDDPSLKVDIMSSLRAESISSSKCWLVVKTWLWQSSLEKEPAHLGADLLVVERQKHQVQPFTSDLVRWWESDLGWEGVKRAALNRVVACPRGWWACIELGKDHPWLEEQQMQRSLQGRHSEGSNSKVSTASNQELNQWGVSTVLSQVGSYRPRQRT